MTRPCLWAIGLGLLPTRFLLLIRIINKKQNPLGILNTERVCCGLRFR